MSILHEQRPEDLSNLQYPFTTTSTLTSGQITIPKTAFRDAQIFVPAGTSGVPEIRQVVVTSTEVVFTLQCGTTTVATFTVEEVALQSSEDSVISVVSTSDSCAGTIVVAGTNLLSLLSVSAGTYQIATGTAVFVPRCALPLAETGLTAFKLPDGTFVSGDVWFVGGEGVSIEVTTAADGSGDDVLRIHYVGEPLFTQAACEGEASFELPVAVRMIQLNYGTESVGVLPNDYGVVGLEAAQQLAALSALRVVPSPPSTLKFEILGTGLSE